MSIELIVENRWKIYFYEEDGVCPVGIYIKENFKPKAQDHINACIQKLAENGRSALSTDLYHNSAEGKEIKEGDKIYQMFGLHKGEHRLYSIMIEKDKTIIFTHGAIKRKQKTSTQDIAKFQQLVTLLTEERTRQ